MLCEPTLHLLGHSLRGGGRGKEGRGSRSFLAPLPELAEMSATWPLSAGAPARRQHPVRRTRSPPAVGSSTRTPSLRGAAGSPSRPTLHLTSHLPSLAQAGPGWELRNRCWTHSNPQATSWEGGLGQVAQSLQLHLLLHNKEYQSHFCYRKDQITEACDGPS